MREGARGGGGGVVVVAVVGVRGARAGRWGGPERPAPPPPLLLQSARPSPLTCRSICGFQSLSYSTTTSAVARLMPRPPARVDSRKTNCSLPGALKLSMAASRSSPAVLPSMRQ